MDAIASERGPAGPTRKVFPVKGAGGRQSPPLYQGAGNTYCKDDAIKDNDAPSSPERPSSSASSEADVPLSSAPVSASVVKLPACALPVQSTLLKRITSCKTKEELLDGLAKEHMGRLDHINLVTCLHRLAKLSYSTRSRATFLTELQHSGTFHLLLRVVHSTFLQAHFKEQRGIEVKGVDARCLSNLVWSLVKLDLPADGDSLSTSIALDVVPFVLKSLPNCSPQGLANMLWAYSRLPVGSPMLTEVVQRLVLCITQQLNALHRPFDAQALSNSVWALAHLKGRGLEVDPASPVLVNFVEALARTAAGMLSQLQQRADFGNLQVCQTYLKSSEEAFSCQALVNIAWSLATVMGSLCASHGTVRQLFHLIHSESVSRLHATGNLLRAGRPLPTHASGGGFNEQALSNVVFAFDKASLLRKELLEHVFMVAALRLMQTDGSSQLVFKPQELCTLLKVCHNSVASPAAFLAALFRIVLPNPKMVQAWSCIEVNELNRAFQLYVGHNQKQYGKHMGSMGVVPRDGVPAMPEAVPRAGVAIPVALGTAVGGAHIAGGKGAVVMMCPAAV